MVQVNAYAAFVTKRPLVLLGLVALVSAGALTQVVGIGYDDDVVRFLPAEDPEVQAFTAMTERFGAMEVALIGVEAPDGHALYGDRGLGYLRALTRRLVQLPEVAHVTSLTELAIIESDGQGGAAHVALVPPEIPRDPEALAAIRARVLEKDYLTGLIASADGSAAVLVTQLVTHGPDGRAVSAKHAAEVAKLAALELAPPPGFTLHFGGAPFIAEAAANGSQDDLRRLAPFVIGITLFLVILSLGSFWAALYTVLTVALAILCTLGLMGALGKPLTLVSSSLPVVLAALGSAYAVHVLVWYREHGADVRHAIVHMGWPVIVTALTTVAGFLSFLVMDLAPMREFGWQMAAGSAIAAALALTLVPALLALKPLTPRPASTRAAAATRIDRALVSLAHATRARRWSVLVTAAAVAAFFALQLPNVDTRMDTAAFFAEDSAPARADRLLADRFGGSVFLQVLIDGDVRDPAVLHRLAAFEDRLSGVVGVTRTESIAGVLAVVHEGLKGERRLSRSAAEIEQLGFLAAKSDPAVSLLVDERWRGALIQVGLGGFDTGVVERITPEVRELARRHLVGYARPVERAERHRARVLGDAAERIAALAKNPDKAAAVEAVLARALPESARAPIAKAVDDVIKTEIVEDEMVVLANPDNAPLLARALIDDAMALALDRARFEAHLKRYVAASELEDADAFSRSAGYLFTQVELATAPALRRDLVAAIGEVLGPLDRRQALRIAAIADEILQPAWYVSEPPGSLVSGEDLARKVEVTVTGQPVLQQAMTRSVQHNQVHSVATSLPLVLLILVLVFRSVRAALIGILPAGLTLLVTFGLMGLFPEALPMDIAASMLASIALGVGIDYAIHFLWRYRRGDLDKAMLTTGRSIVINALEITGGFIVLAWASIAPVSRFGLLIAETLFVAALATLVLLPPLLTWWNPHRSRPPATPSLET